MKKSLLLFALFLFIGMQTVLAQTLSVKGRVTDANSEGIPGAAVKVTGKTNGTVTDFDGNFEIELSDGSTQLTISSLNYETKTVTATANMAVVLQQGTNVLTDVVVTQPYGPPISKGQFVGAADVITAKQIEKMPVSDFTKALEGAAPGLQVTNGGGQPGSGASIRIRGNGSINGGASPLIVLDNAPYDGDLTSINPLDIESINVLKDATATSLYGSRGANGVIVVTTKKGKKGDKPRITVDGKMGIVQRALPNYNVMTNEKDYYETAWQALYNSLRSGGATNAAAAAEASGRTGPGIIDLLGYNSYTIPGVGNDTLNAYTLGLDGKLNPNAQLKYHDDWLKELERTGIRQDYNLNLTGGNNNTLYYLSAGYLREDGFVKRTNYDRFSTRFNISSEVSNFLKIGANISGAMSNSRYLGDDGSSSGNPVFVAQTTAPIYPVYYRDKNNNKVTDPYTGKDKYDYGSLAQDPNSSIGTRANLPGSNILGQMELDDDKSRTYNVTFAPYLEVKLPKNFSFRTNFNMSFSNLTFTTWNTTLHGQFKTQDYGDSVALGGSLSKESDNYLSYTWNQTLSWAKDLGDHSISASVVHENYYYNYGYLFGTNTGFPAETYRELAVATGTPNTSSKSYDERMESYLALANYTYKGKYLLGGNVRRDGLSRFYKDSRWGTFAAIGAGWIISEEAFMKNVNWVNALKLKASYGTQGNNQLPGGNYYGWQGKYDIARPNGANASAIPYTLINTDLKWEAQKSTNIGVEFTLFKNSLSGEINVYNRATSGLYYDVPTPRSTGISSRLQNAASMYNRGVEVNLFITPVRTSNFTWTVNATWTKFTNKITKLADNVDSFVTGNYMYKAGHSIYDFYLVHSNGVDAKNGDELYSYRSTSPEGGMRDTSDYTFANANGREYVGSAIPSFSGSFTNNFSYKGFELSFLVTYQVGGKFYDALYQQMMSAGSAPGGSNWHVDALNSWTETNTSATLPRMEYASPNIGQNSDRFLVSASFLNIRNINLRYSFPERMITKTGFRSLSAYIAADNIALISARKGMNPQQSFSGSSDYVYSPSRTIMFGLTLGL